MVENLNESIYELLSCMKVSKDKYVLKNKNTETKLIFNKPQSNIKNILFI